MTEKSSQQVWGKKNSVSLLVSAGGTGGDVLEAAGYTPGGCCSSVTTVHPHKPSATLVNPLSSPPPPHVD